MKDFFIVFKFELVGFLKNKSFMISTLLICLIIAIGLSVPTIKNVFSQSFIQDILDGKTGDKKSEKNIKKYGVIDENNIIHNMDTLKASFLDGKLIVFNRLKDLEDQVKDGELEAGYIIISPTSYQYMIQNNEMHGASPYAFEEILIDSFRIQAFKNEGIDYTEFEDLLHPTIEVLITSTKSTNLIFGKVLGVALAGVTQFGLIILTSLMTYKLNEVAWDNNLDFIFKIPGNVLISFAVFGVLGYLFYAFIYGALGALVSRTEDVSASATPITMLFVGVFMVSIIGMQNTSGLLLKIASFLPFSSFMPIYSKG